MKFDSRVGYIPESMQLRIPMSMSCFIFIFVRKSHRNRKTKINKQPPISNSVVGKFQNVSTLKQFVVAVASQFFIYLSAVVDAHQGLMTLI